jgi:hypothetical protein
MDRSKAILRISAKIRHGVYLRHRRHCRVSSFGQEFCTVPTKLSMFRTSFCRCLQSPQSNESVKNKIKQCLFSIEARTGGVKFKGSRVFSHLRHEFFFLELDGTRRMTKKSHVLVQRVIFVVIQGITSGYDRLKAVQNFNVIVVKTGGQVPFPALSRRFILRSVHGRITWQRRAYNQVLHETSTITLFQTCQFLLFRSIRIYLATVR